MLMKQMKLRWEGALLLHFLFKQNSEQFSLNENRVGGLISDQAPYGLYTTCLGRGIVYGVLVAKKGIFIRLILEKLS